MDDLELADLMTVGGSIVVGAGVGLLVGTALLKWRHLKDLYEQTALVDAIEDAD